MRSKLTASRKHLSRLEGEHRYCNVAAGMLGAAVVGGVASSSAASKGAKAAQNASNAAIEANAYQGEIATDQYEHYKKTFRPLEEQLAADAVNFDSQANYDKAAADAQASVNSQLSAARERLQRTPGLDPSSAAATAARTDMELKGAALGASEQNKARENIKNMAYARKQDAVALGKGLVSNASSGLASATAGANAISAQSAAQAAQAASGVGTMVSGIANGLTKVNWGSMFGDSGAAASTSASSSAGTGAEWSGALINA